MRIFLSGILLLLFPLAVKAASPPVTTLSVVNSTLGNNGWYISGVDTVLNATAVAPAGIASINYYYDNPPVTTVNFLGNNLQESTEKIFTANGTHALYYWAEDSLGSPETTKSATYKIDTMAPYPWMNWIATQLLNDHTFQIKVDISDLTSGIDPTSAQFQYRTDIGLPYGYHTDLLNCSSPFQTDAWAPASYSGGKVTVPAIDFCNSNWGTCSKYLRIKITDQAGNNSIGQYCINSPWFITKNGDAHAELGYYVTSPAAGNYSADYIVSYGGGSNSGFSSANSWYLDDYPLDSIRPTYASLFTDVGARAVALPSGRLPIISGVYLVDSGYTIDNTTIPNNLATQQNLGAVIFVNGDLTVNAHYILHPSAAYVFIVSGRVLVNNSVDEMSGYFIADGNIDLSYTSSGNETTSKPINVYGGLVSGTGFRFSRSFPDQKNVTTPTAIITLQPGYFFNQALMRDFGVKAYYKWAEVAP